MIEYHIAWTIKESDIADRHLATDLEGRFEGYRDKQPPVRRGGRKYDPRSLPHAASA